MFPPMELDGAEYYLKPMNCPFHILIYRSRVRSYRELPLRLFEFGTVYRNELSGVIHGLTRVRGMTMDDAHIFTTKEQMGEELGSLLTFTLTLLRDYGLDDFYLELSTKPEGKAIGTDEDWEEGIAALREAAGTMDLELVLDEGGGAFYGPKISVQARDAIGRTWQMSTIQVDFQMPDRFDLHYTGADNARHRPIDRSTARCSARSSGSSACSPSTTPARSRCGSRPSSCAWCPSPTGTSPPARSSRRRLDGRGFG